MKQNMWWPSTLLIPAAGLITELVAVLDPTGATAGSLDEGAESFARQGLWLALPFVAVGILLRVPVGRSRAGWWLSLATAGAVTGYGLVLAVGHLLDGGADPLAGLAWVVGPLLQLGAVAVLGTATVVVTVTESRRRGRPRIAQPSAR